MVSLILSFLLFVGNHGESLEGPVVQHRPWPISLLMIIIGFIFIRILLPRYEHAVEMKKEGLMTFLALLLFLFGYCFVFGIMSLM
jgi:hypothetical protein